MSPTTGMKTEAELLMKDRYAFFDGSKVGAHAMVIAEKACKKIVAISLFVAEKADNAALKYREKYISFFDINEPSLEQWVNRLIEHVDSRYIIVAYQYFLTLIESGMSADDAFTLVVNDGY